MSIKKSSNPEMLYRCIEFGLRWAQKMKPCFLTLETFFSSTAHQRFEDTK